MKDSNLLKRYLIGKKKPQDATNAAATMNVEHDNFTMEDGVVIMIFGGMSARPLRHKHKRILQEIYDIEPVMPSNLR
jgi:xanthine dehydrogenase iron-sulfur cluster and FAD-binding subunit A